MWYCNPQCLVHVISNSPSPRIIEILLSSTVGGGNPKGLSVTYARQIKYTMHL